MSEKKIANKDLDELYQLLLKINREVNRTVEFFSQKKYKTKQWEGFVKDWKMNFDQTLLNDKFRLRLWKDEQDHQTFN